ncbi:hypothetical protein [Ruegeria sp.]|uniref:hypothetical protein n=1 Tax=Ruegeria sp. TaxID=1879320 RepID=UPI003B5ACAC3
MLKVLVHQGFHKTGTTTFQRTLSKNQHTLKDRVNVLLPRDVQDAGFSARRYAVAPKDRTLINFGKKLRSALKPYVGQTEKPLLISNEEFAGLIPGRKGVWSYTYTHVLAEALLEEIQQLTDAQIHITLLYTTRSPADWIRSTYWQNLRSNRILEDISEYSKLLHQGADLGAVVDRVRASVSSRANVVSVDVTDQSDRLVPLIKALSILDVRSDDLIAIKDQNVQPNGSAEYFLELNRSPMTDEEVAAAKRAHLDLIKAGVQQSGNQVGDWGEMPRDA